MGTRKSGRVPVTYTFELPGKGATILLIKKASLISKLRKPLMVQLTGTGKSEDSPSPRLFLNGAAA
jgi:hypothetical protein